SISKVLLVILGFISKSKMPKMDAKRRNAKSSVVFDLFFALKKYWKNDRAPAASIESKINRIVSAVIFV
ncbi:MAG TPA: hypothetical protein VFR70_07630, partial [Flavobacterium sp.]|nr:hypothetical protein [Flavobacterium sp.]